jgi:hypothetical protein
MSIYMQCPPVLVTKLLDSANGTSDAGLGN